MLKERIRKARRLPDTQKVIPASKDQVQTKVFSEANVFNTTHTYSKYTCKIKRIMWKTLEDL
jgi:hypothetical protein